MPNRESLDATLDQLAGELPRAGTPQDASFDYDAFQQKLEEIVQMAAPQDQAHVRERVECLLGSAGLIPSDNEGEPCS